MQVHDSARPGDISLDVTQAIGQAIRREDLQNVQVETKADMRHRHTGGVSSNPFEYAKLRNFTSFAQGTDRYRPVGGGQSALMACLLVRLF